MVDQRIIDFFNKLGVDTEGIEIYFFLIGKSSQTATQIAKATHIPKTTVYRRIDELIHLGLVEEKLDEYRKAYISAPCDFLNLLVVQKEQEASQLRAQLPLMTKMLIGNAENSDPETKVLYYRGRDGIRQMVWNTLKTDKNGLVGYTYRILTDIVGGDFANKWNSEFFLLNTMARDLYSDEFIISKNNSRLPEYGNWKAWESRYINPKILNIKHQLDIYNNVVAIYNWHEGDVFGVEIYNLKVANMQRQIFEVLWKFGEKRVYHKKDK